MSTTQSPPKLRIGSIELSSPAVQAALSGYSDWPMRVIAKRLGASYTLCEVMLDQFLLSLKGRKRTGHYLHVSDEEHPVGGQLMGAEPEQFAAGAVKLVEAGFDVIDINFGCPVRKVLGRCRGGFHLSQPETAIEIIKRTRDAVPNHIPVTVKMRRGIDDTQESRDNFFRILTAGFDIGLAAATIHGRTVEQRYVGPSRWEFLRDVRNHFPDKTLIGSGDLFTPQDCIRMLQETGIDGLSIARGCIGNPWIFGQVNALLRGEPLPQPPSLHEQRDVIREHFQLSSELYGLDRCGPLMRKFGIKYAALHPEYEQVRASFISIRNKNDWDKALETWYSEDRPGVFPDGKLHKAAGESDDCEVEG